MAADVSVDAEVPLLVSPPATSPDPIIASPRTSPLEGKRVLVVGINYAPEPTGIAPYTTGMAEHLASCGATVEVLTGLPHYPTWRVPARYRFRPRTHEPARQATSPQVTRLWHYVPRRQRAAARVLYEATFLASALSARPAQPPDLVIAVTPALSGATAGARLAARFGATFIVVVQDLVAKAASQSGMGGGSTVAGLAARIEGHALRQADRVVVVSESFRPAVRAFGVSDDRISVLPNWTHITPTTQSRDDARAALGWPTDRFIVAHTGNMGFKQDLGTVIEAARKLPDGIDVYLIGDGSQRRHLEAQGAGVSNLRFLDPMDDVQYPLALAAADLLLVNERHSVGDMSLPSKLTSYLSAGRPILAAVVADGATSAELRRTQGAGLVVRSGDANLLAQSILELHADLTLCTAMGKAGWEYAHDRLDRAATMLQFDEVLERLLPSRQRLDEAGSR